MDLRKLRDRVASGIDEHARWREMKAEEYPADTRNQRSAQALRDLAKYVRDLPDDDPTLKRLAADAEVLDHLEFGLTGENVKSMLSRYGFDGAESPGAFLALAVDQALADWVNDLGDVDPDGYKVLENKLRRMAARQRLKLVKSRRRDPRAYDWGAYMLVDPSTTAVVAGERMDIGDVIRHLTGN